MKKLLLLTLLVFSTSAMYAQTITADANVVTALTLTGVNDLDFGSVVQNTLYTIAYNTASAGSFSITGGTASTEIAFSLDLPTELTGTGDPIGITYTAGWHTANDATASTAFTTSPTTEQVEDLNGSGALYVFIGGAITPDAAQTVGAYSATITLTAAYN
ncbi:MAG TPA: hypothetical protein DCE78_10085 [Bacteroidetes bacterium]|nr:hypothetical protein [Bacteroidota bacterium]